jgi:hypothetical protein
MNFLYCKRRMAPCGTACQIDSGFSGSEMKKCTEGKGNVDVGFSSIYYQWRVELSLCMHHIFGDVQGISFKTSCEFFPIFEVIKDSVLESNLKPWTTGDCFTDLVLILPQVMNILVVLLRLLFGIFEVVVWRPRLPWWCMGDVKISSASKLSAKFLIYLRTVKKYQHDHKLSFFSDRIFLTLGSPPTIKDGFD